MGERQPVPDDLRIDLQGNQVKDFTVDILLVPRNGDSLALREFVGLWSGWLVVGFMLGGVLGRRSFGGL